MKSNVEIATQKSHAARTELIRAARENRLNDTVMEFMIRRRLWRIFGYERLGDFLEWELGITEWKQWVTRAVQLGLEKESLYVSAK